MEVLQLPFNPCFVRLQLEEVMEEADVGENYEMDPLLAEACQEVVKVACKHVKPGEAR